MKISTGSLLKIQLIESIFNLSAFDAQESKIRSSTTQNACVILPLSCLLGTTRVGYGVMLVNRSVHVMERFFLLFPAQRFP